MTTCASLKCPTVVSNGTEGAQAILHALLQLSICDCDVCTLMNNLLLTSAVHADLNLAQEVSMDWTSGLQVHCHQ